MREKVKCRICGTKILREMGEKTDGLCASCEKRVNLENKHSNPNHEIQKAEKYSKRNQKYVWHVLIGIKLFLLLIFSAGALVNFFHGNRWLLISHLVLVAISIFDLSQQLLRKK